MTGYKYRCPPFLNNVFGVDPATGVHLHIRCVLIDEIPLGEIGGATWLIEAFRWKDLTYVNANLISLLEMLEGLDCGLLSTEPCASIINFSEKGHVSNIG
jgi:hypothetical protein